MNQYGIYDVVVRGRIFGERILKAHAKIGKAVGFVKRDAGVIGFVNLIGNG